MSRQAVGPLDPKAVKRQSLTYVSVSILVFGLAGILQIAKSSSFARFLGEINPLFLIFIVIVLGFVLSLYLLQNTPLEVYKSTNHAGLVYFYGLAALLAVAVIIIVDRKGGYPRDINILFPESLFFYPVIGFIVEIIFHVLPVSLVFFVSTAVFKKARSRDILLTGLFLASLGEPVYQIFLGNSPTWVTAYQTLHIFVINLIQLGLYKKYDFVSMYSFRLVYYLFWHVIWGYLRLRFLF